MTDLAPALVPLIVVMGLAAALVVLLFGGGQGGALAVLLDFLLAAGLLRLSQAQTWTAIATAALTALIRKIAVAGLFLRSRRGPRVTTGSRADHPSGTGRGDVGHGGTPDHRP